MGHKSIILGVDDKAANLVALEAVLDDLPVQFLKASSGQEALQILLKQEVALILMDVTMPEMDGYETAELIRGNSKTKEIPLIFVSAVNTSQDHVFKGYSSGAIDYIFKPILPEVLKSKVAIFIELFQQRKGLADKAIELQKAYEKISLQRQILQDSEVRFRTAFEQSFQFMAILCPEGKVIDLNRLAVKLCGDFKGHLKGQYLWNVCWVGQHEENARLKKAIEKASLGEYVNDEASFTDINGRVHYLYRAVSPEKDDNGMVVYITVQGHDITNRVNTEREKRNLEKLLQQAQKMEALGTLAGGIAHDFNNVLSVIIGNAGLAQKNWGDDIQQKQFLSRILTAANKAKDLVKQILSFSHKSEIERVVFQPGAILLETVKLLGASIPSTIAIEHDIDENCGAIWADPTQYHQVIMNLCTNAFHAMETEGGVLAIALSEDFVAEAIFPTEVNAEPGRYAHMVVSDSGCGIKKENLRKIFDPYFSTKEKDKGAGMGLSIVHGITKSHGGFVTVDTQEGSGSTFHVYIPLAGDKGKKVEETFDSLSYGSGTILLIDDEEQLLEIVKNMLELVGYQVETQNSSEGALELFCDNPEKYDLVITDQTMPGMTGTELARRILRVKPQLPIILCTGYSPHLSRESVLSLGIKELVFKPLALNELSKIVRQVIDNAT